jgi:hypothetical protein
MAPTATGRSHGPGVVVVIVVGLFDNDNDNDNDNVPGISVTTSVLIGPPIDDQQCGRRPMLLGALGAAGAEI